MHGRNGYKFNSRLEAAPTKQYEVLLAVGAASGRDFLMLIFHLEQNSSETPHLWGIDQISGRLPRST
jgi:hypothetical protein